MEYKEWLTDYRNKKLSRKGAKTQRKTSCLQNAAFQGRTATIVDGFPLQLCASAGNLSHPLSLSWTIEAQSRRPLAPADILRVATVGDAQISPSGEWITYTVGTVEGDATRSTLWLVRAAWEARSSTRTPTTTTPADFAQRQPPTRLLPGWLVRFKSTLVSGQQEHRFSRRARRAERYLDHHARPRAASFHRSTPKH